MSALDGSVALVTGATQGIGRAVALRLAADGGDVAIVGLNAQDAEAVVEQVKALGRNGIAIQADVRDRDQVFEAVARTEGDLGRLDIMVNNAGIVQVEPLLDIMPQSFDEIFKVNVDGVLWGIQAAAKSFIATGTKGAIINASAGAGHEGFAMLASYSATKFAIRALTQAAAKELGAHGITVNSYCPGIVQTSMWETVDEQFSKLTGVEKGATFKEFTGMITLGRPQTSDDVAGLVSYMAGPDGRYMTGQSVILDGGILFR